MQPNTFFKYGWLLIIPILFLATRESDSEGTRATSQDCMLGEVIIFAGNFAPRNWTLCEGQLMSIPNNSALFSLLGTAYGGDGRTTFSLPDLRGRSPIGAGNGPGMSGVYQGALIGRESVTLATANLPSHTHSADVKINAASGTGTMVATNNVLVSQSRGASSGSIYTDGVNSTTLREDAVTAKIGSTGANQAFSIRPPSLGINYIICTNGTFPSRQ